MSNFKIIELSNSKYGLLIIATTYISPIQTLSDIEREIDGYTGKVVFDMTIINGMNSNRYLEADVFLGIFDRKSFKAVKNNDKNVKELTAKFYSDNAKIVNDGTIPMALKSLIAAGEIL